MKAPFKCNKCGAPIKLDPYKDFVKCSYCGSTNIFENGRLISKSDRYLNKVGEFLPKLKQRKVFIPLIIFSILVPVGIYKVNYIDDFLVKECQLRIRESKDGDFVAKKNYKKCLRTIRGEWSNLVSSICIDMKKYAAYMSRSNSYGPTEEEKEIDILDAKYNNNCRRKVSKANREESDCFTKYKINLAKYLTNKNISMYSADWSPHCNDQKEIFGKEAVKELTIIECDKSIVNNQNKLCKEKGIVGFPAWEINGKIEYGSKSIEELAEKFSYVASKCSIDRLQNKKACDELSNRRYFLSLQIDLNRGEEIKNRQNLFKKQTLKIGYPWLKNNEVINNNGDFSNSKCNKNLKKVAYLIFGRSKSSFE